MIALNRLIYKKHHDDGDVGVDVRMMLVSGRFGDVSCLARSRLPHHDRRAAAARALGTTTTTSTTTITSDAARVLAQASGDYRSRQHRAAIVSRWMAHLALARVRGLQRECHRGMDHVRRPRPPHVELGADELPCTAGDARDGPRHRHGARGVVALLRLASHGARGAARYHSASAAARVATLAAGHASDGARSHALDAPTTDRRGARAG